VNAYGLFLAQSERKGARVIRAQIGDQFISSRNARRVHVFRLVTCPIFERVPSVV
jgi:hypothetical protein